MSVQINQRQILQNVQKAIGTVIFVSVLEFILIAFSFSSRQVYESISTDYHQASIEILSKISEEMAVIRYEILYHEIENPESDIYIQNRELVRSVYLIEQHNEDLQTIERQPNHNQFNEEVENLDVELSKLSSIIDIDATNQTIDNIISNQNITNIKIKVDQLRLLHHQVNDLLLKEISDSDKRNILMIVLVALMMLGISIYIIRRSVKIIRSGLDIQLAYQEQLAEEKSALYKKEVENREILSSVIEGIVTIDETGKILTFNKAAEQMYSLSKHDVIGQNIKIIMPRSDAIKHDDYLHSFLETRNKNIIGTAREVLGWNRESGEFPIRLNVSELPSQPGEPKRFIGSMQDLTQIKSQEEQIRRTQKMDALGKLTGGIAHDYNNMLAVISGYANLLADQVTEDNLKKYATEIAKAGERGAQLTRRLLSFSKRTNSNDEPCHISDIIKNMSDMLTKTLTARIQLIFKLDENLPKARLNPGDLEDAILNICINSMHAIDGNGSIEIHTSPITVGFTNYVEIRIIDDGCGMNDETREQIFDPFYTTKGDKGTGLGLSQVYSFVDRNHGSVNVESKLGIGTTVVIRFPAEDKSSKTSKSSSKSLTKNFKLEGSVLVVDDETQILDYLTIILEEAGLKVRAANNGVVALRLLETETCDVVLSDIIMPDMNGIELAGKIQKLYPDIKIQLATGYASDIEMSQLDDKLAEKIITKPYEKHTILKRMAKLLNLNSG